MPQNVEGYRYVLLIGDLFSKYIEVVPLRDQTSLTISQAFWESWLSVHGCPKYLLTDQGSNVDGDVVNDICTKFHIEKRRTSGYHSQCNGFAERSVRSVKEMFRTSLQDCTLPQIMWRSLLSSVVFALNTSVSSATKCAPYEVIYGRKPILPIDPLFAPTPAKVIAPNPVEYIKDVRIQLKCVLDVVTKNLNISRKAMMKQYNSNLNFYNYQVGDKVWVKRRRFKPGESRKLSPRNTGPWTIVAKKNNGVAFEILNASKQTKIIHHDRLLPYNCDKNLRSKISTETHTEPTPTNPHENDNIDFLYTSSESESEQTEAIPPPRRYPLWNRRQWDFEGYVSWDQVDPHL